MKKVGLVNKQWVILAWLLMTTCLNGNAQDVVFKCKGHYYAIKSSSWDTPIEETYSRYMMYVNMNQLTLPFSGGLKELTNQVEEQIGFSRSNFRLKEVLLYADSNQVLAGELRYKLKITPYYYHPVSIPFTKNGLIVIPKSWYPNDSRAIKYNYCDAIEVARTSKEFERFLLKNEYYDKLHQKKLGGITNIRITYSQKYKTWVWELYATAGNNFLKSLIIHGKVAYVDAATGKLIAIANYRHFNEEASLH